MQTNSPCTDMTGTDLCLNTKNTAWLNSPTIIRVWYFCCLFRNNKATCYTKSNKKKKKRERNVIAPHLLYVARTMLAQGCVFIKRYLKVFCTHKCICYYILCSHFTEKSKFVCFHWRLKKQCILQRWMLRAFSFISSNQLKCQANRTCCLQHQTALLPMVKF